MKQGSDNLIWVDLEMTGLYPARDYIIEIASVVTDNALNILAEGPVIAIHQGEETLAKMDEWNTRQHRQSGLTERVRKSRYTEADAERITLDFIRKYVPPGKSPICGNSICQDRRFLARFMPELEKYFHYRNLDVSSIKELAMRWTPEIANSFTKKSTHRAMEDIKESIEELKHYREHLFKMETQPGQRGME